jgi:hypothetical protein
VLSNKSVIKRTNTLLDAFKAIPASFTINAANLKALNLIVFCVMVQYTLNNFLMKQTCAFLIRKNF